MSGELEKELRGAVAHEKKMGVQGGWMEDLGSLLDTIDALRTELATERAAREKAERERDEARHEFKNFHRNLCERFDYCHDEKDWRRDQVSLIEHIARRAEKVGAEKDALRGALTAARDRFNAMRRTPYADEMAIMAKEGAFASHAALSPSPGEKP